MVNYRDPQPFRGYESIRLGSHFVTADDLISESA